MSRCLLAGTATAAIGAKGPRGTLEAKPASLFEELERRAEEDDRRAEEHAQREEEWRRQEEARLHRERRARIDKARAERLSDEITAWRLAQEIREYVAVLRLRLEPLDDADRDRVAAWCDWAEDWTRRSDPTVNVSRITGLDDERDRYGYPQRLHSSRY